MKYLKYLNLTLVLAFIINGAIAQVTVKTFSLEEAREYAIANNKSLKNVHKDVELAKLQIYDTRSNLLPQVSGAVDYMTNFNYEFEFNLGGEPQEVVIDPTKLDAGDLEVMSLLDQMFGSNEPSTIKMTDQLSANVQVSQLIYNKQLWIALEMAKMGAKIAEKSIELNEIEIREQVTSSYNMILITETMYEMLEKNEADMIEVLKHTQNMYDAGVAEKTDVDQLKINISQLKNSKKAMERNIELSYNLFRFILGLEESKEIKLTTSLDELIDKLMKDNSLVLTFELDQNPTYQILKSQEELGEKNIDMQKWAYAPSLVGFYSYKQKILTSGFDLSPNHAAGMSLSVPIWNGGATKHQIDRAKIELEKVKQNTELLSDQLHLQNEQIKYDILSAMENFKLQQENVEIAKSVLNSYSNKYQQGILSSLELTQANMNYLQAENNYISSKMDLLKAKLALDKLYNKL